MANISARERARAAMAARATKKAEQERLIQVATQSYYDAQDAADQARDQIVRADADRARSVAELATLGEPNSCIAELCGIDEKEVRALRKTARSLTASADPADTSESGVA